MIEALILTGFLGSGKTTLLGRLLRSPEFSRTAVIINEFGEIGLDHELIEASEDSLIELQTGCLCCKIRNDLATTIHDLLRRRDEGVVGPFTRLVIETSGLADPAPVLQTLMTDAAIAARVVLGGIVTTVDAVNGAATLEREEISAKQAAVADRLLLTKTDLASPPTALLHRLKELNAAAPVVISRHGEIDVRDLLDGPLGSRTGSLDVHAWLGSHSDAGEHHHGHEGIDTYALACHEPLHAVTLTLFLETLAEHCGADLLRLKGIVNILESPERPAVIHGVQHVFHAPAWLPRWPSADRHTRMVFITRGISRGWIEALLAALDAEVSDVSAGMSI